MFWEEEKYYPGLISSYERNGEAIVQCEDDDEEQTVLQKEKCTPVIALLKSDLFECMIRKNESYDPDVDLSAVPQCTHIGVNAAPATI